MSAVALLKFMCLCECVKLSCSELEAVEEGVIEAVLSTVLRLPEMNFRSVKFTKVTRLVGLAAINAVKCLSSEN